MILHLENEKAVEDNDYSVEEYNDTLIASYDTAFRK